LFDTETRADIIEECSKYGKLKNIFIDKNSKGNVYLKYDVPESAIKAANVLHGRWFGGKEITVLFLPDNNQIFKINKNTEILI
jgi:RNA-binding protein 23/39